MNEKRYSALLTLLVVLTAALTFTFRQNLLQLIQGNKFTRSANQEIIKDLNQITLNLSQIQTEVNELNVKINTNQLDETLTCPETKIQLVIPAKLTDAEKSSLQSKISAVSVNADQVIQQCNLLKINPTTVQEIDAGITSFYNAQINLSSELNKLFYIYTPDTKEGTEAQQASLLQDYLQTAKEQTTYILNNTNYSIDSIADYTSKLDTLYKDLDLNQQKLTVELKSSLADFNSVAVSSLGTTDTEIEANISTTLVDEYKLILLASFQNLAIAYNEYAAQ